jgi:hypothetical protein
LLFLLLGGQIFRLPAFIVAFCPETIGPLERLEFTGKFIVMIAMLIMFSSRKREWVSNVVAATKPWKASPNLKSNTFSHLCFRFPKKYSLNVLFWIILMITQSHN